ncbi:MAG: hypothetical protein QXE79_04170 [Candidatus Bathyarchaeia archaeon]
MERVKRFMEKHPLPIGEAFFPPAMFLKHSIRDRKAKRKPAERKHGPGRR